MVVRNPLARLQREFEPSRSVSVSVKLLQKMKIEKNRKLAVKTP